MSGWKTWVAGIGGILAGLGVVAAGVVHDGGIDWTAVQNGGAAVLAGFGVLGLGHKLDKNTDAVKENTEKL